MAIAHSSTHRIRFRTARTVSSLTCQIGVRISSTSAVLTSETGRRPMLAPGTDPHGRHVRSLLGEVAFSPRDPEPRGGPRTPGMALPVQIVAADNPVQLRSAAP